MTVLCPADFDELRAMLRAALTMEGPVAIRYPRGGGIEGCPPWSGAGASVLRQGRDVTLVSYGTLTEELLKAAEILKSRGVEAEVIKLHRIAPLDPEPVLESVRRTGRLLVLEDCLEAGSVGQRLAAEIACRGIRLEQLCLKNLGRAFAPQGKVPELRRLLGLDGESVAAAL